MGYNCSTQPEIVAINSQYRLAQWALSDNGQRWVGTVIKYAISLTLFPARFALDHIRGVRSRQFVIWQNAKENFSLSAAYSARAVN